jgi:hypothetical protein
MQFYQPRPTGQRAFSFAINDDRAAYLTQQVRARGS